jgi:hypothetical protein
VVEINNQFRRKNTTMPKYDNFEELPVWKEAALLYNRVLDLLEEPGIAFSAGFRNQLDREALSISNNVAEGFERVTTDETAFLPDQCKGFQRRGQFDDCCGKG